MNRRTVIRHLMIASAGATFIPSCIQETKPVFLMKKMVVTGQQQELIAVLSETIIPRTPNFPGANDLKTHEFLLTMLDDCSSPEEQKAFSLGLLIFDEACLKKCNGSYVRASISQRIEFLKGLEAVKDKGDGAAKFYETVKHYTLQAFTSSKQYLEGVKKFTLVPGSNFRGCVPVGANVSKKGATS